MSENAVTILKRVVEKLTPAVVETVEQKKPREIVLNFAGDGTFTAHTKHQL